ncbi:PREDICTED: uncharacterized protein LOC18594598 [Theobroma cacao]|uniref:Uncharacterized protein LOC18594598 n=1 Tax=Theobroma cacao TaxID=3641 RepID=A0AB32WL93_THECC|nr:PREDICTED: uncharacterized protein LOC18594598 [Theobroma cacao]
MEHYSSSQQVVLLPSYPMLLFSLLINVLIEHCTTDERQNLQAEITTTQHYYDFSDETTGKDTVEIAPSGLLELGQSSCQTGTSEISNPLNSLAEVVQEVDGDEITAEPAMEILPRFDEAQVQNLRNGLKVASLVISVSTTGIFSFLAGFPTSQHPTMKSKLLFKAGILSMSASLFSALVLLVLSTNKAKFSALNLTVGIIIWISTGLMTLAVVLLIIFYLQNTT